MLNNNDNQIPKIFKNNVKYAKITPLKSLSVNTYKEYVKDYPASNLEWNNSVYTFNKSSLKLLPIINNTITKLIRSYFNFYNSKVENKINLRPANLKMRFRRLSVNRVFVSGADVKHTNSKAIVTVYLFNQQRKNILNALKSNDTLFLNTKKDVFKSKLLSMYLDILNFIKEQKKADNVYFNELQSKANWKIYFQGALNNKITKYDARKKTRLEANKIALLDFIAKKVELEILGLYYKKALLINNNKFEESYVSKLSTLISKMYNKKVEFNFVNLKYHVLNSDIMSEIFGIKLRVRKVKLLRLFRNFFTNLSLPEVNKHLNINDTPNYDLTTSLFDKLDLGSLSNKDELNKELIALFSTSKFYPSSNENIEKRVLTSIKHKHLKGVRIETKGRISRRLTAARSLFKFRYKGSLQNLESSFRSESSVMLRGHMKSNVGYTNVNSKTRNGAFGLKGWVSGV